MGSLRNPNASGNDAFVILEQTIQSKVMEDLQAPLAEIVHGAIRNAINVASQSVPSEPKAVTRPAAGGRCAQVWETLDKTTSEKGEAPTLQEVQKLAKRKRWNANTARVQYYRWRSAQSADATV